MGLSDSDLGIMGKAPTVLSTTDGRLCVAGFLWPCCRCLCDAREGSEIGSVRKIVDRGKKVMGDGIGSCHSHYAKLVLLSSKVLIDLGKINHVFCSYFMFFSKVDLVISYWWAANSLFCLDRITDSPSQMMSPFYKSVTFFKIINLMRCCHIIYELIFWMKN
jgi:hypothetical protein